MGEKAISMNDAAEFAKEMQAINWANPMERLAVAQVVAESVKDAVDLTDPIRVLGIDVQKIKPGDSVQFVSRKGARAYIHAPGTAAPRSMIVNRVQTLDTELVSVNLEFELNQLKSGRYGSVADIKEEGRSGLIYKKWQIIWDTIRGSIASGAANYWTSAGVSPLDKMNALDSGIDYVADQPGRASAIIGRRSDLSWLLKGFGTTSGVVWADAEKSKILKDGLFPVYRGIPVIELNSYKDIYGAEMITTGTIMVLNESTLKVGQSYAPEAYEALNADTLVWNIHLATMFGCGVFFPERNARIVL